LPGSRKQEIQTMLRIMLKMTPLFSEYQFVIAAAPSVPQELYDKIIKDKKVAVLYNRTYDLVSVAEAALVTSGTATLETALLGTPEVVCYRGSRLSFWIARRIVHVKFISLVNLIMDREVVVELIQHLLTRASLAMELKALLDPAKREALKADYQKLRTKLGGRGASDRTASLIIQYLKNKSVNNTKK